MFSRKFRPPFESLVAKRRPKTAQLLTSLPQGRSASTTLHIRKAKKKPWHRLASHKMTWVRLNVRCEFQTSFRSKWEDFWAFPTVGVTITCRVPSWPWAKRLIKTHGPGQQVQNLVAIFKSASGRNCSPVKGVTCWSGLDNQIYVKILFWLNYIQYMHKPERWLIGRVPSYSTIRSTLMWDRRFDCW